MIVDKSGDVPFFGTHSQNTLMQMQRVSEEAVRVALMADGHLGYAMPVGGVAAFRNEVPVTGVGYDIACGNCALLTSLTRTDLGDRAHVEHLADRIASTISFGVGRTNTASDSPDEHPLFVDPRWGLFPAAAQVEGRKSLARQQLGTVGSGNHYVDVFVDEVERVWVGVHFGSRGLGHGIASGFLNLANGRKWGDRAAETEDLGLLSLDSTEGMAYWELMRLAGDYAYAGREWVARKVVELLAPSAQVLDMVHNHHNFAWEETHDEQALIVVRKGATPAFPGQRGFVGGSMGDCSVILEGAPPSGLGDLAMYSTVHGAGRVMSRTEAGGKYKGWREKRRLVRPGKVSPEMLRDWIDPMGVVLRGGGLDEAPHAYRRLPDVLRAQGSTIRVLHTLQPVIVCMAGANEFDPYKD